MTDRGSTPERAAGVMASHLEQVMSHLVPDGAPMSFTEVWWSQESCVLSFGTGVGYYQMWLDTDSWEHDGRPGGADPVQLWAL